MNAPMAVNFDSLLGTGIVDRHCRYDDRDSMLYAFGLGFGRGVTDPRERRYLYEGEGLATVPTMAGVLLDYAFLEDSGWDPGRVTLAEQKLNLYRQLPASADLRIDSSVVAGLDHGGEGVSLLLESEARMARDATVLFDLAATLLTAAGGGFRGPVDTGPLPHRLPSREPDLVCDLKSFAEQALLFRLCDERDPRNAEDAVARALGYPRAPLQQQCVAGLACRAVLHTVCEYDFTLIAGFDARFTGTLYPGEVLTTQMWQERNVVSFRSIVRERNAVVLDNGKCTLAA